MIIGITGKAGAGKDTVCDIIRYLTSELVETSKFEQCYSWEFQKSSWKRKAFADNLKKCCSIITNTPLSDWHNQSMKNDFVTSTMTYREFMQKFGTDALRMHFSNDIWIDSLFSYYLSDVDNWIIPDVRFINEASAIREKGGIIIRVERNTKSKMVHVSETELVTIKADQTIYNFGTIDQLINNVKTVLIEEGIII